MAKKPEYAGQCINGQWYCECGERAPFGHLGDVWTCKEHRFDVDMLRRMRTAKKNAAAPAGNVTVLKLRSKSRDRYKEDSLAE